MAVLQKKWSYHYHTDNDFIELAEINGAPPKVVLVTGGNFKRQEIAAFLEFNYPAIKSFAEDNEAALLVLNKNRI